MGLCKYGSRKEAKCALTALVAWGGTVLYDHVLAELSLLDEGLFTACHA
jgi:hypothetical protein